MRNSCIEYLNLWNTTDDNVLNLVKCNNIFAENDIFVIYKKGKVNMISPVPGMGKTSLWKSLACACGFGFWILKINLNEMYEYMSDHNIEGVLNDPIEIFFKLHIGENKLTITIFQHFRQIDKIAVFLDAFNEVTPNYIETT